MGKVYYSYTFVNDFVKLQRELGDFLNKNLPMWKTYSTNPVYVTVVFERKLTDEELEKLKKFIKEKFNAELYEVRTIKPKEPHY